MGDVLTVILPMLGVVLAMAAIRLAFLRGFFG